MLIQHEVVERSSGSNDEKMKKANQEDSSSRCEKQNIETLLVTVPLELVQPKH
jgi:hypothetical protein